MCNAPILLIICCGVVGLLSAGATGLFIGIGAGILVAYLIGAGSMAYDGGLLPRKARVSAAIHFDEKHSNLIQKSNPDLPSLDYQNHIEQLIEKIYRDSQRKFGTTGGLEGMTLEAVSVTVQTMQAAAMSEAQEELLEALLGHITSTMY